MEGQGSRLEKTKLRDGRTLTYFVRGSGPPLVCHPGGPGFDGFYFEDLAGLDAECTLVLVNPAGTDGSDPWPEDAYSLTRRADDVDDLRAALGVARDRRGVGPLPVGRAAGALPGRRAALSQLVKRSCTRRNASIASRMSSSE